MPMSECSLQAYQSKWAISTSRSTKTARVCSMSDNSNEITFTYLSGNASGHGHYDLSMTVKSHSGATTQCYFTINEDLIVSHCTEVGPSGTKEWDLSTTTRIAPRTDQGKRTCRLERGQLHLLHAEHRQGGLRQRRRRNAQHHHHLQRASKTNKGCIMPLPTTTASTSATCTTPTMPDCSERHRSICRPRGCVLSADKSTTDTHEYEWGAERRQNARRDAPSPTIIRTALHAGSVRSKSAGDWSFTPR